MTNIIKSVSKLLGKAGIVAILVGASFLPLTASGYIGVYIGGPYYYHPYYYPYRPYYYYHPYYYWHPYYYHYWYRPYYYY